MNEGKICVSVTGKTAEDLLAKVESAGNIADIIEIRADGLNPSDLASFFEKLSSDKILLITLRPIAEGGMSHADFNQRLNFWMSV
jgi:3-dehydroquinate dehydratase